MAITKDLLIGQFHCTIAHMADVKASLQLRDRPVKPVFSDYGLAVIESHHSPCFAMGWHCDAQAKILIALSGSGILDFKDQSLPLSSPSLATVPAGVCHRIVDAAGMPLSLYLVCFDEKGFPGAALKTKVMGEVRLIHDRLFIDQETAWLRQMLYEGRSHSTEGAALQASLAAQLLVAMARFMHAPASGKAPAVVRVRSYIAELGNRFWQRESMNDVAARLRMSRRQFSSLFRAETGSSWLEYVHARRIMHAARLLREDDIPTKSIAFECGYDDLGHFYRRFSRHYGTTPGKFRRQSADFSKTCVEGKAAVE